MLRFLNFSTPAFAECILNGGVSLPRSYSGGGKIGGLHGLSLVFSSPAVNVVFDDPTREGLYLKTFIDQIKDAGPTLRIQILDQTLFITLEGGGLIEINGSASTARTVLGLPNATVSGTVYNPPDGTAPRLVSFADRGTCDGFVCIVEE